MHAESFEMLILLVEPRNLPIRVRFRFRFRFFFCFETTKMTETDRHFGEQTTKRPVAHTPARTTAVKYTQSFCGGIRSGWKVCLFRGLF